MSDVISFIKDALQPDTGAPLEVRLDKKLVGHWSYRGYDFRGPSIAVTALPEIGASPDMGDELIVKSYRVEPVRFGHFIPDSDLNETSSVLSVHLEEFRANIAPYARIEPYKDPRRHGLVVEAVWMAIKVSSAEHEELFDNDAFIPVDVGPPDYEARYHIEDTSTTFEPARFAEMLAHPAARSTTSTVVSTPSSADDIMATIYKANETIKKVGPYDPLAGLKGSALLRPEMAVQIKMDPPRIDRSTFFDTLRHSLSVVKSPNTLLGLKNGI